MKKVYIDICPFVRNVGRGGYVFVQNPLSIDGNTDTYISKPYISTSLCPSK